jgi:hypothetical protein
MFASRYFNPKYWAKKYWPRNGAFAGPSFNVPGRVDPTGESVKVVLDTSGESIQARQIGGFALQSIIDPNGQLIRVRLDISGQSLIAAMDNTGIASQGNIKE